MQYFKTLLNVPENMSSEGRDEDWTQEDVPAENEDDYISWEEVKRAVDHMRNNKSPGYDGLPAEIFKKGGDAMITWMQGIFNTAWKEGRIPDDWGKAVICPVFKNKGDRAECGNYRGISLLPHITKIYERILERRLRSQVEDGLGEWHYGFRPNRNTADLIFSMKMIFEKTWEYNDRTYLAFLDLEKAFDRVPRNKLWKAMQKAEYDLPAMLRRAI